MVRLLLTPLVLLLALAGVARSQGMPPVDVALVLAVDASGSIDDEEFALQRQGIATAITHPRVLTVIQSGHVGAIAIAYVEWGGPGTATTVVGWHMVGGEAQAQLFARAVIVAPRSAQSFNAMGDAIDHSAALIAACPCQPIRKVIDISGDNPDNRSRRPVAVARNAAMAAGITVNALAVVGETYPPDQKPWLVTDYETHVIGGAGAFVMAARGRDDFTRALLDKLVIEMSGTTRPAGHPDHNDASFETPLRGSS